jgi:hypothetical protein
MDTIHTLDAMPMMADVISGAVSRPDPFHPSPVGTSWQKKRCWWHYAVKTPAGKKALELIGCTVDIEHPWEKSNDGWRVQPWTDRGEIDTPQLFGNAVAKLREAIGDSDAGVFFAEICNLNIQTCEYIRSHQTMIALNIDGTRAAIAT